MTVTNSWKTEFAYDGLFRRRIRKEYVWSGSWLPASETRYVYDGRVVLQERDGNNLPSVTYTRGLDLSGTFQGAGGIGGLLARTDHQSTLNQLLPCRWERKHHGIDQQPAACVSQVRL